MQHRVNDCGINATDQASNRGGFAGLGYLAARDQQFLLQIVLGGLVQAIVGGASDDSFAGYAIADLIVHVVITPLSAIAATVMYVELRRLRGQPLDIDMDAPPATAPPPARESPAPGPEATPPGPQAPPG